VGAGWVAGVTRARAMASRCLGDSGARQVAAAATLGEAVRALRATPYRRYLEHLGADASLADAQRAVTATLLWHLRVLAGWQPRAGVNAIRLLAAGFEIANVEDHARAPFGAQTREPYRLGALATAWPRLAGARTPAELRAELASSPWGDPGGESLAAVATGMRIAAADRLATAVPSAAPWAAGRAALLVAREVFVAGRRLPVPSARRAARLLGAAPLRAASLTDFADFCQHLQGAARWAVARVDEPGWLWRAEARWWVQLEQDAAGLLRGSRYEAAPVVGAVAMLSADAWRVRAGLELAARGGRPGEVCDALA
jgi:ATP synthase (C/AC39) subunit